MAPAIDAALLKVNSRFLDGDVGQLTFPDFSLTVNYADSMCDSAESVNHAIEFYMAGKVSNIICVLSTITLLCSRHQNGG